MDKIGDENIYKDEIRVTSGVDGRRWIEQCDWCNIRVAVGATNLNNNGKGPFRVMLAVQGDVKFCFGQIREQAGLFLPPVHPIQMVVHEFGVEPVNPRVTRVAGQKVAHGLTFFDICAHEVTAIQQ
uniref:Uncharacterized protein n=1 Tax=Romanomermis culicivorax TaxID=13658 RepID=A0A915HHR9_ROMCU